MTDSVVGVVHVHSNYSHDGRDTLERLREFALERGIGFVGLTDHAEDFERDEFVHYAEHCRSLSDERVRLIAGLEFRFAGYPGLHLLALGLSQWISPRTPGEFIEETLGVAGLTIVAHPVLPSYMIPEDVRDGIDAIEVWNASYNTRYLPDPKAIQLLHRIQAVRPGVVGTAGLDQHDASNDRETRVVLELEDAADPLKALKAGRFYNRGKTMRFGANVGWSALGLAGLSAVRWVYDAVEHTQDRVLRVLR